MRNRAPRTLGPLTTLLATAPSFVHHTALALRPSWSPDGHEVVYQVGGEAEDGSDWEIYSVRVDGGAPRRLTNNSVFDIHPDWNTFQLGCRER